MRAGNGSVHGQLGADVHDRRAGVHRLVGADCVSEREYVHGRDVRRDVHEPVHGGSDTLCERIERADVRDAGERMPRLGRIDELRHRRDVQWRHVHRDLHEPLHARFASMCERHRHARLRAASERLLRLRSVDRVLVRADVLGRCLRFVVQRSMHDGRDAMRGRIDCRDLHPSIDRMPRLVREHELPRRSELLGRRRVRCDVYRSMHRGRDAMRRHDGVPDVRDRGERLSRLVRVFGMSDGSVVFGRRRMRAHLHEQLHGGRCRVRRHHGVPHVHAASERVLRLVDVDCVSREPDVLGRGRVRRVYGRPATVRSEQRCSGLQRRFVDRDGIVRRHVFVGHVRRHGDVHAWCLSLQRQRRRGLQLVGDGVSRDHELCSRVQHGSLHRSVHARRDAMRGRDGADVRLDRYDVEQRGFAVRDVL
jgi:hypothetical protein